MGNARRFGCEAARRRPPVWAGPGSALLGSDLASIEAGFLRRAGVDADFLLAPGDAAEKTQPRVDFDEHRRRLAELRRIYRERRCWPDVRSVWSERAVAEDLPFDRFRSDCAFLWQKRDFNSPAAYVLTYLYLKTIGLESTLRELGEDGAFGCYTQEVGGATVSRDLLDSACEIHFLREVLGVSRLQSALVLDVGAGYGRLAHRLAQLGHAGGILCVDAIPESAVLCEAYLRYRGCLAHATMVPLPDLRGHLDCRKVQIATNIHGFSECPLETIAWWLRLLAEAEIEYLFIVPNGDSDAGRALLSTEASGARHDYSIVVRSAGYRRVALVPKYAEPAVQRFGVSPTHYHLFQRVRRRSMG